MSINLKTIILLGLIQVIILTLVGLWFLRMSREKEQGSDTHATERFVNMIPETKYLL